MHRQHLALIIPAGFAVAATLTDYLPFKMAVPLVCAAILLIGLLTGRVQNRGMDVAWVVGAFAFSAAGDYFLSNKSGNEIYFVVGIGLYFVAHIGYLVAAWKNGRVHLPVLGVLLGGFLIYYFALLNPAIPDVVLSVAVLLYLAISCLALAVAAGMNASPLLKTTYVIGIALIVLSDTIISFNEFLGYGGLNALILPTYYAAHLLVSTGLMSREGEGKKGDSRDNRPQVSRTR